LKKKYDIAQADIKNLLTDESTQQHDNNDIALTEDALINFAKAHSLAPPSQLREKILGKLQHFEYQKKAQQKLALDELPWLGADANWLEWQDAVDGIAPPTHFKNIHLHTIESNEKRELFVAWVKEFVPEEVHHDVVESFLILEGSCECHITNPMGETRIVRLGQGDFYTMQTEETHDIIITSLQPAKAIIEWRKLAA
jgi:mannose-6-phosphate isomerase-like protein (cupin superfamily)